MRRLALLLVPVLAACGGGNPSLNTSASTAAAEAAAQVAQSGVRCEPEAPPVAVQACSGKAAGDVCTVTHEDHSFTGACAAAPNGRLVCQPPAAPPPPAPRVTACAGKAAGDACSFTSDDGTAHDGACRAFASGVLACVQVPPPVAACTGKAAGDACSFTGEDGKSVSGLCTARDHRPLACVPPRPEMPPRPPPAALPFPQEIIDACTGKAATDACSFTFHDHAISGACRLAPDGTTLVCAPLCVH